MWYTFTCYSKYYVVKKYSEVNGLLDWINDLRVWCTIYLLVILRIMLGNRYSDINGWLDQSNDMSAYIAIHFNWYDMDYVVKQIH